MDILSTISSGIVIAIVSSWITVRLSLHRFRAEKWWERRVDAYERLIDSLHNSKALSDFHLEAEQRGRELSEEQDRQLRSKAKDASREIDRAIDLGSFLLGDEAVRRLKRYRKDEVSMSETTSWVEYLVREWEVTDSCLKDLVEVACRE